MLMTAGFDSSGADARWSTDTLGQQVQILKRHVHRQWRTEQAQMPMRHVDGPCVSGGGGGKHKQKIPKGRATARCYTN